MLDKSRKSFREDSTRAQEKMLQFKLKFFAAINTLYTVTMVTALRRSCCPKQDEKRK